MAVITRSILIVSRNSSWTLSWPISIQIRIDCVNIPRLKVFRPHAALISNDSLISPPVIASFNWSNSYTHCYKVHMMSIKAGRETINQNHICKDVLLEYYTNVGYTFQVMHSTVNTCMYISCTEQMIGYVHLIIQLELLLWYLLHILAFYPWLYLYALLNKLKSAHASLINDNVYPLYCMAILLYASTYSSASQCLPEEHYWSFTRDTGPPDLSWRRPQT